MEKARTRKNSPAEEHPAQLFLEQLGGTIWGELCGKKIARLDAHEFRRRGELPEAIEIEQSPHRINRHQALLTLWPILNGYAEHLKRHVHCGDSLSRPSALCAV